MACDAAAAAALLLLFLFSSSSVSANPDQCAPSCGNVTIKFPFRLRGDPSYCGYKNFWELFRKKKEDHYELTCDSSNHTILNLPQQQYLVKDISYQGHRLKMNVIEANMTNGSCPLTSPSLTNTEYIRGSDDPDQPYDVGLWAAFVNCTKEVKNNSRYRPLPRLSRDNNFIYIINDSNSVDLMSPCRALFDKNCWSFWTSRCSNQWISQVSVLTVCNVVSSCRFLAMRPMLDDVVFDDLLNYSSTDICDLLAQGFNLNANFNDNTPRIRVISYCLSSSFRLTHAEITNGSFINRVQSIIYGVEPKFIYCIKNLEYQVRNFQLLLRNTIFVVMMIQFLKAFIVLTVLGRFVFVPLTIYAFLSCKFYQMISSVDNVEKFLRNQQTLVPTRYSYTDIIAMTGHFKEKLGEGGFGSVFKGRLPWNHLLAIKMLRNSKGNTGEEFINEVSTIGRIHHVNVVKLIGFCSEGPQRALVYEYMPNGSLDKYIFSPNNGSSHKFSADKLIDIALGVARGIDYLHKGCDMQILHFDIKPHNILLDHNFNPKVSDFGLAKLYPRDYNIVSVSAARGTIGYIAPEMISRSFGVVSHKSDVYSFGMLLLEMAGGRRNADPRADNSSQVYYPSWIYDKLNPVYGEIEIDSGIVIEDLEKKLCMVGLWCIQMRPSDRPSMNKVVEMLEGDVDSLQMPPKPFFSAPEPKASSLSCLTSSERELTTISEDEQ
ncbi:hypothetical protein J5N97_007477 [Dioscorea zingiberensis]|uniref:Protein kinase domain-containing protein n=1 Tax=Dioscorea zingiberensis TaxID=325984 RepID=A0A9D5DBV2_9LILI|nr:hypothetical protein J5N97_007477 [Dioscorea zingiberensis]